MAFHAVRDFPEMCYEAVKFMGEVRRPQPVLFLLAAFSAHQSALNQAREQAFSTWGEISLESPCFSFEETDYYAKSMGRDLRKVFWCFERLIDPEELPARKLMTNNWEEQISTREEWGVQRPVNLDPGYIALGKLVLASTKDHAHRLYLASGIYGEVTLAFREGCWQPHPWTFPDYQRDDYHQFFSSCRDYLRQRLRHRSGESP